MKKITFEKAYQELQSILKELQEEMVNIDTLTAKTKRAAELIEFCQNKLHSTEEELKTILGEE